jgi:hypothetical protein
MHELFMDLRKTHASLNPFVFTSLKSWKVAKNFMINKCFDENKNDIENELKNAKKKNVKKEMGR